MLINETGYPPTPGLERVAARLIASFDAHKRETDRAGPINDLWRVDIAGVPVMVKGAQSKDHLQQVNSRVARMKMALHRIAGGHSADPQYDALQALEKIP